MLPRLLGAALAFGLGAAIPPIAHSQTGPFNPGAASVSNQAWNSIVVNPSDQASIPPTRAIYNGNSTACTVTIVPNGGSTPIAFSNVQPGEFLPVQAIFIKATGTTCSGLVALY